jgi:two-component system, cell cycle sensor histidine kinase and response regulator CckA
MATSPHTDPTSAENYHYAATILLVDDDEAVRRFARIVLDDAGYRVLPAQDAPDALRQAQLYPERIEALVTDVMLPGVSGRDLAESISATRPGIKVLFLSGHTDEIIGDYALINKGVRFLMKPYTPARLVWEVEQVLLCENQAGFPERLDPQ